MNSLVIRGGYIVYPWGIIEADIYVEEGVVKAVGRGLKASAEDVIDAHGLLVLPGVVDEHVHMREPGLEYKDNFTNGTLDAAAGGVTTVLEMPNTLPPVDSVERFHYKRRLLEPKAYVDFGLYGVIHDGNIEELEPLVKAGVVGFKIFLGPTTGNIPPPSKPTLYRAMEEASKLGTVLAFHAEDWELVEYFTRKVRESGRNDPEAHVEARPPLCEEIAIRMLASMAKATGAHVHIVHVTSCEAVEAIRDAKNYGARVTGETNPHYLLLDSRDYRRYEALIKVNPPIREPRHRECLWKAIYGGVLDAIGSDHAPHTPEEKMRNIWEAASGFPGVYTLLPLMIDQALRGRLDVTMVPRLLSENPARIYGLYPVKGCLLPGCDGDIVLVDPRSEHTIDKGKMHCKSRITPFYGWRLKGVIRKVILRGNIIYSDGEINRKPLGKFIKPIRHTDSKYMGSGF